VREAPTGALEDGGPDASARPAGQAVPRPRRAPGGGERAPAEPAEAIGELTRAALLGGLLVALIGCVEMVAWTRHWTPVLRVRSEYSAIKFNSALALTAIGAAIALAAAGRYRPARAGGALGLAIGAATLVEMILGRDLGLDELVVRDHLASPGHVAGRMTLTAALCFVAMGSAVLTWRPDARGRRARALCLVPALVAAAGVFALCRYLANVPNGRQWRGIEPMAIPTSLALCLVAAAMLALIWRTEWPPTGAAYGWIAGPAGAGAFVAVVLAWQMAVGTREAGTIPALVASRAVLVIALLVGVLLALAIAFGLRSNRRREEALTLAAALSEEVSRRTRAERTARESESMVTEVFEALPVGIAIFSPDGRMRFINRVAATLNGRAFDPTVTKEELSATRGVFVAGTDRLYPTEGSTLDRALAGEASYSDDVEIHQPTGAVIPIESWGTAVRTEAGEISFAVIVAADISERRASERAVVEQAALLDLARDAIFALDGDRRITYWSHGAEACFGWSREEAIGRVGYEFLRTEFPHRLEVEDILRREGHWDGELVKRTKTGARITLASRLAGGYAPDGSRSRLLVIDTDITARKAAEEEQARHAAQVSRLNVALTRSNEELEQFAYIASHDLSEPLRAISGPVSLLARRYQGRLDAEADEFIGFAVDGCDRMQALINDLLAFSRVGGKEWSVSEVDLGAVLGQTLAVLGPALRDRDAVVRCDPMPVVVGDASQLAQVLQNLIGNAVKFTPADRVPRIGVGHRVEGGCHRFTVTDNGIGIAERHRERIFGMFKRLHGNDEYPGTGIGLALCQKIVQRHGGAVGVAHGPDGCGSAFWFTLPIHQKGLT
jgi:PAS domain S-box-containing protein